MDRRAQAMRRGKSSTIRLQEACWQSAYTTAVVRDGRIHFFPDIYGQDKVLDDALARRSQSLRASNQMEIGLKSNH
jgi:murein L,D-transpeptidase YcbB/YkuD